MKKSMVAGLLEPHRLYDLNRDCWDVSEEEDLGRKLRVPQMTKHQGLVCLAFEE